MTFNIIFSFITLILIILAVLLKGKALDKLFYLFILNLLLIIFVNRGASIALLFAGTIIPLFPRNRVEELVSKKNERTTKDSKKNMVSYVAFAPVIGLIIMTYRLPFGQIKMLSPEMVIFGEASLLVITFLVLIPKRIKLK